MFTNDMWVWFIVIPTLGGIAGLIVLIRWMSHDKSMVSATEEPETMGHVWDEDLEEYNNPLPMWWLNAFYLCIGFGLLYLVLYPGLGSFAGLFDWTQVKQYEQEMDAANSYFGPVYEHYKSQPIIELAHNENALKIGQRLFITYCTTCHGSDAGGIPGYPNLRDDDWLWGGQPEAIKTTIMQGRLGVMPPWLPVIHEEGVKQVAQYVISLSGRKVDEAAAVQGKELFTKHCTACHGSEGKGMQALGAPNLTDKTWLYGGSQATIEKSIREGRQGKMPAHGEFLGEAKAHLLATYVYSLSAENVRK